MDENRHFMVFYQTLDEKNRIKITWFKNIDFYIWGDI